MAAASKGCERPNRADMDQGKRGGGSPLSWSWVFSPLVPTLVWHGCVWGHLRDSLHCFPCCPTFSCDNSQSQPHPSAHCCRLFPTCGSRHQHPFGNSSQQEEVKRGRGGRGRGWWQRSGVLLVVQDRLPAARHTCHARQCHQCERHQGTCKSQRPPRGLQTPHFRRGVVSSQNLMREPTIGQWSHDAGHSTDEIGEFHL